MILLQAMNPVLLVEFMRRLVRQARRKVFLILDNLMVRHAPPVRRFCLRFAEQCSRPVFME